MSASANFMGARFTASEQALAPVLRETAKRGLIYFDDGVLAAQPGGPDRRRQQPAFAKADMVIDAVPTPADIDRALARLEAAARERGVAVGFGGGAAGVDRPHRALGQGRGKPRHPAGADQRAWRRRPSRAESFAIVPGRSATRMAANPGIHAD